ncbi:MAG: FCD domain-containing protein [Alphaproteobacteria bacterium]|nr:MAG: FCD domain-containing protein [Alphaproteobacteria bacterium]
MPFRKIDPERLSRTVARQIEELILRGILRPGERLPGERELAERLGVSRPSLREALTELEADGLVVTRPGSGVYVAELLGPAFTPPLIRLFAEHDEALFDFIAFRRDLEGLAAERAALRGTDGDLEMIDAVFRRMEEAQSDRRAARAAELDAEFHLSIIEASHNIVLIHMMRAMFDLLRQGVLYNRQAVFRQRSRREALHEQHRAINAAIQSRDGPGARAAVTAHLDFVEAALRDDLAAARRDEVARMRLARKRDAGRASGAPADRAN